MSARAPVRDHVRDCAVVNASPLIYLSKVNQLPLLRLIAPRILVPNAVVAEIAAKGPGNATSAALEAHREWLVPETVTAVPNNVLAWDLGAGESEVIATALTHANCPAIIDDALARKCATTLKVELFGTLGLVLIAKQRGLIQSARTLLSELRANGMFLSAAIVDQTVALVDE